MKKLNCTRSIVNTLVLGLTLTMALPALAAKSRANCYLLNKEGEAIQGANIDTRYEIASVSKIMTSLWAVSSLGADYRYETRIHILAVGKDLFDIHIEGSGDPFYNREQFQFLISELNSLGIKSVRNLTFDENFKYLASTRQSAVVVGHYTTAYPQPSVVEAQLKATILRISDGYQAVLRRGKDIAGLDLPAAVQFKVAQVKAITSADFQSIGAFTTADAKRLIQKSVPLRELLKEMNRSSNNYAANLVFENLGGATHFQEFAKKKMGLEEAQIRFLNGSGDRFDYEGGKFAYNEATCSAILSTVATLKLELENQKYTLADVMAVAGADAEGESSTVSSIYGNEVTSHALIAKTGTVSPSITLAGMASTEQGEVYFGNIYGTDGSVADWRQARNSIRTEVVALFKHFTKKKEIDYSPERFMTFDADSRIVQDQKPLPDHNTDQVARAQISKEAALLRAQQQAALINSKSPGTMRVEKP